MKKKVILIVIISLVFIGLIIAVYVLNQNLSEKKRAIANMELASRNATARNKQLMKTRDSVLLINKFLARYRTLTVAMLYRDSVRLPMKYKIGDMVCLKQDSSRAIVTDIVAGGGKHEYYIRYKIIFKNGSEKEIAPELLY
jgi:hypothetical protein